jgi:HAD superfamily hydrolase (TIGR01509 family)
MIEAAIFDMDGLLIDSEPLWTQSEIEVFATVGIELDEERCRETVGLGLDEVVEFRFERQPWTEPDQAQVAERIHARVLELIVNQGQALPGARTALAFVREKNCRVGLATASDVSLIEAVLQRLKLNDAFDHLQSADSLAHSKPHPQVYLETARRLGVAPQHCVAFEDSVTGLIAAKAASMWAVAIPEAAMRSDPRYGIADLVLDSLVQLDDETWARLG